MPTSDDKFYRAKITKRVDFAPDLWMIRIQPGGEFRFAPGQYATLGVQGAEKRSERAYSIVSSPYEGEMEFFFELVPQGELTPQLYKLQLGDELLMRKVAKGRLRSIPPVAALITSWSARSRGWHRLSVMPALYTKIGKRRNSGVSRSFIC